jgi:hypothetical protein
MALTRRIKRRGNILLALPAPLLGENGDDPSADCTACGGGRAGGAAIERHQRRRHPQRYKQAQASEPDTTNLTFPRLPPLSSPRAGAHGRRHHQSRRLVCLKVTPWDPACARMTMAGTGMTGMTVQTGRRRGLRASTIFVPRGRPMSRAGWPSPPGARARSAPDRFRPPC